MRWKRRLPHCRTPSVPRMSRPLRKRFFAPLRTASETPLYCRRMALMELRLSTRDAGPERQFRLQATRLRSPLWLGQGPSSRLALTRIARGTDYPRPRSLLLAGALNPSGEGLRAWPQSQPLLAIRVLGERRCPDAQTSQPEPRRTSNPTEFQVSGTEVLVYHPAITAPRSAVIGD